MFNPKKLPCLLILTVSLMPFLTYAQAKKQAPNKKMDNSTTGNKLIIYQLLPRLFGNTKTLNKSTAHWKRTASGS